MHFVSLSHPDRALYADVHLDGSKSLSNRALIALALAGARPDEWLTHVSAAGDTAVLRECLQGSGPDYDAGDAGTAFRFLTAYLTLQPGVQTLTGSERMRQRPIGALVNALRTLGGEIEFLEKEGFPPLRIGEWRPTATASRLSVRADVSSQFLSALLLIAPYLPHGLEIVPEGALVSRPYIDMTLGVMRHFGADAGWHGDTLRVAAGRYTPRALRIEADWSAASYWYAMAALSDEADVRLHGLFRASLQGDAAVTDLFARFGVTTDFEGGDVVRLRRARGEPDRNPWSADFNRTPDIAQTLAVVCAGLGVPATLTGLGTLAIKETDRIAALRMELARIGVTAQIVDAGTTLSISGQAAWKSTPRISTYGDHRMAMAFAPLALLAPIEIEYPDVVQKSYPAFWQHLEQAGFSVNRVNPKQDIALS